MADVLIDQDVLNRVEDYVATKHRELRLPGLALAIVQDDRVIYQRGFGRADPTGRWVTPQTPFIIGSLSKSFTALAIMQLVEAGKIDLDAPVQRYLPWFRVADPDASARITIRHLLLHTGGLSLSIGRQLLGRRTSGTREQAVRALKRAKLAHEPGVVFEYSNTNYLILSLIIEIIANETYERYIEHHIFEPLGMAHSFTSEEAARNAGLATGYRWWFGWPWPIQAPYLTDALGAAFLISSAEDLARWLRAHLSGGSVDGTSVLSPAVVEELHRPQAAIPKRQGAESAMGWRVQQFAGEQILQRGGEVSNFRADMVIVPGRNLGIVVLANANNGLVAQLHLDQIALDVLCLVLGQPVEKQRFSFSAFTALVDTVVLLLSAGQVWAWMRLLRPGRATRRPRMQRAILPALASDILAPLSLLWSIPRWFHSPWSLLRQYVPDLSCWLLLVTALSLLRGVIRVLKGLRVLFY